MFLSFFILRFFSIAIPAQAGIHCAAGICVVANATHIIHWIATVALPSRDDKKVVCAGAQDSHDLGPVVKPRGDTLFFFLKTTTNIKTITKQKNLRTCHPGA